jgi:hypothetical protein
MTNEMIMNLNGAMNDLMRSGTKIPMKLLYAININQKRIKPVADTVIECRNKITDELATKDEEGNPVVNENIVDFGDNTEEAEKRFQEVMQEETELEFHKVRFSEIEHMDLDTRINPNFPLILEHVIEEPAEMAAV